MRWLVLVVALMAGFPVAPPLLVPPALDRDPHLDVLFVGAHPDDEHDLLSTFGQWHQRAGVRTGIATITRGEGGGNAAGPEEGPQLGKLREDEERRVVGQVGVQNIHYLDKPDLYYTVSAPLTDRSWHHDDVLGRLVRIVRQTRPGVVVTMDPAPTPGNHGNHQYSARLAMEAYRVAGDPNAYPEQLHREGLQPWAPGRVLSQADRPSRPGRSCEQQQGVAFRAPADFKTTAPQHFQDLAPGASQQLDFPVTSTDPRAATGAAGGDYHYSLDTSADGSAARTAPALEVVPSTDIQRSSEPPKVDGRAEPGEYAGAPLDLSSRWEGAPCSSPQDCSATARMSWHGDELHALIDVRDDVPGTRLAPADCKRHWRTDAVELALDPFGRSENTSSTFKLGVLPRTDDPAAGNPPCFERDADNQQGPGPRTAPGTRVAAKSRPGGYAVELSVPLANLPGGYDPRHLGVDLLVYDSDTQDKTGQTRIGWSSWPGVQGDPYRWGRAELAGAPAPDAHAVPPPALPVDALQSVDSPPSIEQAVRVGTTPGGAAPAGLRVVPRDRGVELDTERAGTAHVFAVDGSGHVLGEKKIRVPGAGRHPVAVPVSAGTPTRTLVGFTDDRGATAAAANPS